MRQEKEEMEAELSDVRKNLEEVEQTGTGTLEEEVTLISQNSQITSLVEPSFKPRNNTFSSAFRPLPSHTLPVTSNLGTPTPVNYRPAPGRVQIRSPG